MPTRDDFQRLLKQRMGKTVKQFKLIGNLARYPHDRSDAEAIVATLQAELDMLRAKYKIEAGLPVPVIPAKNPDGAVVAVDGRDRRDIRAALRTMHDGDIRGGVKRLQKVVLAWPVPDKV